MKRILSLDGGGAKGPMQLSALAVLEQATGKKTHELFDLIVGTSVGAINGSMLSMGQYSASELLTVMKVELPKVFKKQYFKKSKYSKVPLEQAFVNLFGPSTCLGEAKTKLVITSYEDTEGRMHFFKSWEDKDSTMSLFEAVDRSSSAPLFFGPTVDKIDARVWLDGGVGIFNNPSLYAYEEVRRLGWPEDKTTCISLGCGNKSHARTFLEASTDKKFGQILNYIDPIDGGLARRSASQELCSFLSNRPWDFYRINAIISEKMDKMDQVKYFDKYVLKGHVLSLELVDAYDKSLDK